MNPIIRNLVLSLVISAVVFTILKISPSFIPPSIADFLQFAIILAAVFLASQFGRGTGSSTSGSSTSDSLTSELESGTVKWFNVKKGYGFITRDQGDDVFVHYRNIEGKGRRALSEGQRVTFIVIDGEKGLQADEVEAT